MSKHGITALALLAIAGCASSEPELMGARGERLTREAEAASQAAGDAQNGATYTLPVGGSFTVRLSGNRTTGYAWAVAERPEILTLTGENYVQDPSAPGMVGVGGKEEFVFHADRPGRGVLRLEQRGAGNRGVAERWLVNVIVR